MPAIPNLFIPGAAKSATTYLSSCLGRSNDIFMPGPAEMHYMASEFMRLPLSEKDPFKKYEEHIIAGFDKYTAQYENSGSERYRLDCSPTYMMYDGTAGKIKSLSPDAFIIISLRNPVERAFSQYKMNVRMNFEKMSFEQALEDEPERLSSGLFKAALYKEVGMYSVQVSRFIDAFGTDRIKFVLYDEIADDPGCVISEICSFLNIEFNPAMVDNKRKNYTGYPRFAALNRIAYSTGLRKAAKWLVRSSKARERLGNLYIKTNDADIRMKTETRKVLTEYFSEDIERLESATGIDLRRWRCDVNNQ
ncbi:MAG: sulfotransferase [Clostridia bacterium]